MAVDIGAQLTAVLLDGRRIGGRVTLGDMARAEAATGVNYMERFGTDAGVTLLDLAHLTFEVAKRSKQYDGSYTEWVLELDTFEVPQDATETNGNGAKALDPTQLAVPDVS